MSVKQSLWDGEVERFGGREADRLEADTRFELGGLAVEAMLELTEQTARWGSRSMSPAHWMLLATEEFGEIAKAVIEDKPVDTILEECSQLVALLAHLIREVKGRS